MAAPGEWFPQAFASTILQAAESRRRADAQLSEMRQARAAENFIQEEKLRLGQTAQANQQLNEEVRAEIAREQAKLQAERIKTERQATIGRNVTEFGRTGFAFIPTEAADKIPSLMGEETDPETGATRPTVATIELPGYGTILQRIGGPGFEKQQAEIGKINALTEKYRQDSALSQKRAEVAEFAQAEKAKKIELMEGKFSLDSVRLAHNIREGLRKQADLFATQMLASPDEADQIQGRKATADPRVAFPEGSRERDLWERTSLLIDAGISAQKKGIPLPGKTDVEVSEALGMDDIAFGSPLNLPPASAGVKIVGRIQEGGQVTLIGEGGQRIPAGAEFSPQNPSAPTVSQMAASSEQVKKGVDLMNAWRAAKPGSAEKKRLADEIVKLKEQMGIK